MNEDKMLDDTATLSEETVVECGSPKPKVEWEYKTEFGINAQMRSVIDMSIKVAEAEIEAYKRKIDKLTYGS